ncbi:MAG: acyltransferase domain-containing protein, partial [Deltaproteobacteria bacterium]|nr:acyltransferase domain-containing protein [Deltaproteobacteria bacterium]
MSANTPKDTPVAIIGMGCFFAGSDDLKGYWRLLLNGEDAISEVPDTHWSVDDYYHQDPKTPDHVYCRRGGFLSPMEFDPTEFGIPPNVMEATDTSQLLALVASKMALQDAGYLNGKSFDRDRTSVILGATGTQELAISLGARLGHPHWRRALADAGVPADTAQQVISNISDAYVPWQESSFPGLLGNVIAGRICNRLDLGGTNCVVDAACASSLSAIHLALLELETGRSDMVLTGGVDLLNDIFMHMCFTKTQVLSFTEDIRPFSKDADGTLLGEGVGILAMKRLSDAERDHDRIYAVIRSLGSASDGRSQSIYAPRSEGQEKALRRAYDKAGVDPNTVELIEAHGTGTRVGDEVEFQTLRRFFGETSRNGHRCALGSVKSMIGHAKAAAGSAGLIKTTLALHHKVLPPTLKAESPDPKLGIEDSPFYLNGSSRPWFSKTVHPRRAGLSAFGFGGSNFHMVLEEYRPSKPEVSWDASVQIYAISKDTPQALTAALSDLETELIAGLPYAKFSHLATQSRVAFSETATHRLLLVVERSQYDEQKMQKHIAEIKTALKDGDDGAWKNIGRTFYGSGKSEGKVAFLFPGQGSQYINMAKDAVCRFPEAFETVETASRAFSSQSGNAEALANLIYPIPTHTEGSLEAAEGKLRQTEHAQPAIGTVGLAMAKILDRFGVRPDLCCGHSFGELTALCAAGWIDEETFNTLAATRGRCMAAGRDDKTDTGTMLAVMGPIKDLEKRLSSADLPVVMANRNSPDQGVLSGSCQAIETVEKRCKAWGFRTRRLAVSAAFHSPFMEKAQQPFAHALAAATISPTTIPVLANVTGDAYPAAANGVTDLLGRQLVSPVDFLGNLHTLYKKGARIFLETGPRSVLTGLVKSTFAESDEPVYALSLDSSSGKRPNNMEIASVLCQLAALGHPVALDHWEPAADTFQTKKMRIPLSGANYRTQRSATRPKPNPAGQPAVPAKRPEAPIKRLEPSPAAQPGMEIPNPRPQQLVTGSSDTMKDDKFTPRIDQALRVAEQGLKSMQALQLQTAEAHQKFLDTQSEAGKAIRELMAGVQQMTHPSPDSRSAEAKRTVQPSVRTDSTTSIPTLLPTQETPATPPETPISAAPSPSPIRPEPEPVSDITVTTKTESIRRTLQSVVSRLTGYPEEMLGLDMDIESDLGIDSIKRVEILSAMEEAMPNLPAVAPDVMGSLKTLGQIVEHLTGAALTSVSPAPSDQVPSPSGKNPST